MNLTVNNSCTVFCTVCMLVIVCCLVLQYVRSRYAMANWGAFIRGVLNYLIISPLWILKLFTLQEGGRAYIRVSICCSWNVNSFAIFVQLIPSPICQFVSLVSNPFYPSLPFESLGVFSI